MLQEIRLNEDLIQYQLEKISTDYEDLSVLMLLQHERGGKSIILKLSGVQRYLVELPPFEVDSPYIITNFFIEKLSQNGKVFLKKNNYGHLNNKGDIYCYETEMYRLKIEGDINIDIIYKSYLCVKGDGVNLPPFNGYLK